jgi:hypothetical protein
MSYLKGSVIARPSAAGGGEAISHHEFMTNAMRLLRRPDKGERNSGLLAMTNYLLRVY